MEKKRTLLIAGGLLVAVLVALAIGYTMGPPPPTAAELHLETQCMAALDEWQTKQAPRTKFFGECEQHYAKNGKSMQASFFAQARKQSTGK